LAGTQILYLTDLEHWSTHAVYQATRLFVSNLNAKLVRRLLSAARMLASAPYRAPHVSAWRRGCILAIAASRSDHVVLLAAGCFVCAHKVPTSLSDVAGKHIKCNDCKSARDIC